LAGTDPRGWPLTDPIAADYRRMPGTRAELREVGQNTGYQTLSYRSIGSPCSEIDPLAPSGRFSAGVSGTTLFRQTGEPTRTDLLACTQPQGVSIKQSRIRLRFLFIRVASDY